MNLKSITPVEINLTNKEAIAEFMAAKATMDKFFSLFKRNVKEIEDITKVVLSYEIACELDGIKPLTLDDFKFLPEGDRRYHSFDHQAVVITRVLNQGWVPNWNDSNEQKWYNVFKWVGSGFSLSDVYYVTSRAHVGSRHHFKREELARFAATQFPEVFNNRMII